ncbi:hypothetical protein AX14_004759 [Amanita brunnescens Koide BX004]|nr:hypothetical protein AX14_004759 [Amanita brunnescens Koide BX004]
MTRKTRDSVTSSRLFSYLAPPPMSMARKRDFEEFQTDFNLIDDEDDVESSSSSHQGMDNDMILLAQQFAAAKEKRREEKEIKLLKTAEKQLDKELHKPVEAVETMKKNILRAYEKFVTDYATGEDKIRGLWAQLFEELEKINVIERALHEKHDKASVRHEEQEIGALSTIRSAYEEKTAIIQKLSE